MSLRIATNVPSVSARRALEGSSRGMDKAMAQVSSGSRITKAADDAAGLSISEGLKSGIRSYKQALRNTHDGVSLIQVAEGAMGEVSNTMTRLRELGIQAASDTVGDKEREFIQNEVHQLKKEIDRIAQSTKFGDKHLLNGEGDRYDFQVGINADASVNAISYDSDKADVTLTALGAEGLDFSSKEGAKDALEVIDAAQNTINGYRANLGALQNRLITTTENIGSSIENMSMAKSRIRDADIAESTADLAKNSILQQATTSMLSQANVMPQQALKLVG